MRPSAGKISNFPVLNKPLPTTSISRLNSSSNVRTSIFDKPMEAAGVNRFGGKNSQEAMDTKYYVYVKKLIKERQKREKEEKRKVSG